MARAAGLLLMVRMHVSTYEYEFQDPIGNDLKLSSAFKIPFRFRKLFLAFVVTADPRLTTNRNHYRNLLKTVAMQTATKTLLKFYFELHFEFCAQSIAYHYTCYWEYREITYLNPHRPAGR
jgi:hypothetical protein